ncbi:MAG: hypothetical protein ACKV2T_04825 [Kofleriaceae bacterium]
MPSQRLLKMLDPRGHLGHRVLDTKAGVAVCFVGPALRDWVAHEIADVGLTPLLATSFRHVATSLHASARPAVQCAILDFDMLSAADISQLISLRWMGYRGRVIALARSSTIDARTRQLASVEAVIAPSGTALREQLARPAYHDLDDEALDAG